MSSLARTIQKRIMAKRGTRKVPVLHPVTGNVLRFLYPRSAGQLIYTLVGNHLTAFYTGDKHHTLQPILDILEADYAKRRAAAA